MNTKAILTDYVRAFNDGDEEIVRRAVPNSMAEDWMLEQVPRIAIPDKEIERSYYFRWWTYRKHLRLTPEGTVLTEFLPDVPWSGDYNTIPCAVGHHIREGRWLKKTEFLDEYIRFWLRDREKQLHKYSNWFEAAVGSLAALRGGETGLDIADALKRNLQIWYDEQMTASGLFWSDDNYDGSEYSISGRGLRTTLNSYIYGGNLAVARLLERKGDKYESEHLIHRVRELYENIEQLWDEEKRFYITFPQKEVDSLPFKAENRRARELFGYLPWMFGLARPGRADAFKQLLDENGFLGKAGLSFAERRHSCYGIFYTGDELNTWLRNRGEKETGPEGHECLWNGPSWPFATSLALTALSSLLTGGEEQNSVTAKDYVTLLHRYAASQKITLEDGRTLPWIDENLNPDTGDWIARTRLANWGGRCFPEDKGGYDRGKDYNHSTFCDLVLEGLFGIRPDWDKLRIMPLFPKTWEYAIAEDIIVHGKSLTILYNHEIGYDVLYDGKVRFHAQTPENCEIDY